ncbi:MAG: hypothetical protein HY021_14040, partial [Burkholderiales bacterium]|nr:hypothetical protein [Burkholderiales bacterium]
SAIASAQPLDIIAFGDQPYWSEVVSGPAWQHLLDLINAERPLLAIHVGDLKDGVSECSDALYQRRFDDFQRVDSALVYTPGDNEWVDCRRSLSDPLERLQALRALFFGQPRSLGRRPIALQRQSDLMPAHAPYRENLRFLLQGVLFATVHTVGPDNNFKNVPPALLREAMRRDAADIAWLKASFALAREQGARAIVVATQGDPFREGPSFGRPRIRTGFHGVMQRALLPLATQAGVPVLLIHGDSHQQTFDQPFADGAGRPIANLWRLEVPGDPRMHAVKLRIDPAARRPFAIGTLWNPLSPDPRP